MSSIEEFRRFDAPRAAKLEFQLQLETSDEESVARTIRAELITRSPKS